MLVPDSSNMFHPVGYQALFGNILKGLSIQKRPPEAYCDMCVGGPARMIAKVNERNQLTQAHSDRVAIFFLAPSSFFVVHDDHEPVPLMSN